MHLGEAQRIPKALAVCVTGRSKPRPYNDLNGEEVQA